MEQDEILRFLQYPDRGLVDYAISCANLTAPEAQAIHHRVFLGETIEAAAESLLVSPGTIKNRSNAGYKKLDQCWSGKPWINSLIKQ